MIIEHIQRGRYILNLSDNEANQIKRIAVGFHKTNRCTTLRQIIEAGIAVYNDLIEQSCDEDSEFKDSLKVVCEDLVGD